MLGKGLPKEMAFKLTLRNKSPRGSVLPEDGEGCVGPVNPESQGALEQRKDDQHGSRERQGHRGQSARPASPRARLRI